MKKTLFIIFTSLLLLSVNLIFAQDSSIEKNNKIINIIIGKWKREYKEKSLMTGCIYHVIDYLEFKYNNNILTANLLKHKNSKSEIRKELNDQIDKEKNPTTKKFIRLMLKETKEIFKSKDATIKNGNIIILFSNIKTIVSFKENNVPFIRDFESSLYYEMVLKYSQYSERLLAVDKQRPTFIKINEN